MSDIPHFLSDLQAYADATFLGASTQFINFSIDDCETFMAIILKHIVKIINKAKKEQPDSLPYITLMLALTRFDEILNILNKMEKLEKITGFEIPTSNKKDSLVERVIIGGAKCDEECKSNVDCTEKSCPSCKDSTCQPETDIVVKNNNEKNRIVTSIVTDILPYEVTDNQLELSRLMCNNILTKDVMETGLSMIQESSKDAVNSQIYYLNALEKQLEAAVSRRIKAQEDFTRYTTEAEEKMKAKFQTILKKHADRLKFHEGLEHSAGLVGAVTGAWWAIQFSASAIDLITRFKRGILNCGAWTGLGVLKILREYLMFSFLDTINTKCVGMNPFDPMYPATFENGTTTNWRNEWTGYDGTKRVYHTKDKPGWNVYTVNSTEEIVPNYITTCQDYELFDLENFTGVPLYIILGMLTAILTSVFMYYLVRVGSLQTKLFTKREKKKRSTFGKISDTVGDVVGTVLTFTPAVLYYIAAPGDERAILEEIVREMRIPQNGDLQSLDEYIKAQGELLRNNAEYKILNEALKNAMEDENKIRNMAQTASEEGLKNLSKRASEQTRLLASFTTGIFTVSSTVSNASSHSLKSIANRTNTEGPLKLIANIGGSSTQNASARDNHLEGKDENDEENDDEDSIYGDDEYERELMKQRAQIAKKKQNKKKGGKNKTKKNKNSKKTKKHLLKNNKHKSKRTKQ